MKKKRKTKKKKGRSRKRKKRTTSERKSYDSFVEDLNIDYAVKRIEEDLDNPGKWEEEQKVEFKVDNVDLVVDLDVDADMDQEKKVENLIFDDTIELAFDKESNNTQTTVDIDKRTVKFLRKSRLSELKAVDYDHDCEYEKCNPKNVVGYYFDGTLVSKNNCSVLLLNPNIYYCDRGKFHDCGYMCPGNVMNNSNSECACSKTGISKDSGLTSFSSDRVDSWSGMNRGGYVKDNYHSNRSNNTSRSKLRDIALNRELLGYSKKNFSKTKIDTSVIKLKNNRLKTITRSIIQNCPWLGETNERIESLIEITLLDKKCTEADAKVKNSRKYSSYISILTFYHFMTNDITDEQLAIQYGLLSFHNYLKEKLRDNEVYSKNAKNILRLIKLLENLGLSGILPGKARINNQISQLYGYHQQLNANQLKYIDTCARSTRMSKQILLPDIHRCLHISSYDMQKNQESNMDDCMDSDEVFYKPVNDFPTPKTDLTSFPKFNDIKEHICYILVIYFLVVTSGSKTGTKRTTIDLLEAVVGGYYYLASGYSIFKDQNCHGHVIPKIKSISSMGYLIFVSEFRLFLGIKNISKAHKDGMSIIRDAMQYHIDQGLRPEDIRRFILYQEI